MPKITSARITIGGDEVVYRVPIDGIYIVGTSKAGIQKFCDLFGLKVSKLKEYQLHITVGGHTIHIVRTSIEQLRIILYELSLRGLDLAKVEGMEDRFLTP